MLQLVVNTKDGYTYQIKMSQILLYVSTDYLLSATNMLINVQSKYAYNEK